MAKQAKTALDLIREIHGSGAVFGGNESVSFSISATSSGSLNLDNAIGCDGIPNGRLVLWSGPESSGKTLGSLCYGKKKQAEKKRLLFIDAECTWDASWASQLGLRLDPDWMMVSQESSGAKIFDLLCGKPANKSRKKPIPGILSEEVLEQMANEGTPLGAIILDSINAVSPPLEVDMDTGDQQIGSLSRFLPPMLRRLTPLLKKFDIPMICICQARNNIGQLRGDPLTVSGGNALRHAASLWIDSRKINGTEIYDSSDKNAEKPIGHIVKAKIRKNKVGPPGRKAEMTIYYTKGVDLRPELIEQGLLRGLIRHEGNTLYYSGFEGGKVVGKNNAIAALFNDRVLAKRLLEDILNHRLNSSREAKKGTEFYDENDEEAVAGKVTKTFTESEEKATYGSGKEVEGKHAVLADGTRVNKETGEVVERKLIEEEPEDDILEDSNQEATAESVEIESSDDYDLSQDEEEQGKEEVKKEDTPTEEKASLVDVDDLPLKTLKELARDNKVPNWYRLSSDDLKAALKKGK